MRTKSVFLKLICALSAYTSLSSCASIINGKTQKVSVSSDPSGACIYVDGNLAGITPTTVVVDRKHSHNITLVKEGYIPEIIAMNRRPSMALASNLAVGALAGLTYYPISLLCMAPFGTAALASLVVGGTLAGATVDSFTGGAFSLTPATINATLKEK